MRLQPIIVTPAIKIEKINVRKASASIEKERRYSRTVNDDSNVHQGSSTHDFEIGAIDPVAPHDLRHYHTLTKQREKGLGKLAPRLDIALHRRESAFDIICSIKTKG